MEEADESALWLELIVEDGMLPAKRIEPLLVEANELAAIFFTARRTSRGGTKS